MSPLRHAKLSDRAILNHFSGHVPAFAATTVAYSQREHDRATTLVFRPPRHSSDAACEIILVLLPVVTLRFWQVRRIHDSFLGLSPVVHM